VAEKRITEKYLNLLACPKCHYSVEQHADQLRCRGCGRTFPVVDGIPVMIVRDELDDATHTSIASWDEFWNYWGMQKDGDVENHPYYSKVLEHIHAHGPAGDWGVFLECGCGNGSLALGVARSKKTPVVGIDFSLEACRCAQRLFAREGEDGFFVAGDIQALPFQEKSFGYIFAGGSLEHFVDTSIGVNEAFRVCRENGKIFASVPSISLTTLIVYQTWGNIPDLPVVRPLAEWLHIKLLKSRHMKYGYEKSFTKKGFGKYFQNAGFRNCRYGLFDYNREMKYLPFSWMKKMANWLMSLPGFWPMFYIEAER